ncbi:YbaB/EbfC family nucleoid-associated protein [Actinomadura sp. ATCC 31491]|uniref:YbaB/EbfC family nucleoid-associated protein n=1 Tax=Actinomadura luzonensis TaxID=2805427 RepID=A0ABT0G2B5_9ACTN|nr:YbaB/EbfC family nucleoid-associated protein [Actinomadura luzonensis]MCK2218747.1 YbaB/EbfC family nucleoid-associated protein [Actinomadura luzonensis]
MTSPAGPFDAAGDPELARLMDGYQRDVAAIEALRDGFGEVRGRGEAADGRIVAEASQTGALTGLVIDPRAMRLGSGELAAEILRAAARAARAAGDQAAELAAPFLSGTPLTAPSPGATRSPGTPYRGAPPADRPGGRARRAT